MLIILVWAKFADNVTDLVESHYYLSSSCELWYLVVTSVVGNSWNYFFFCWCFEVQV